MKKLLLLLTFVYTCFYSYSQSLNVGDQIADFTIPTAISPDFKFSNHSIEGDVAVLDFWATWCSPCITALDHLSELQDKFNEELQVISISDETPERVWKFIKSKELSVHFAIDQEGQLREYFPHRTIPHSVLIAPDGEVLAITQPENITEQVIKDVLAGKKIQLPLKAENMEFDYAADHFQADSKTEEQFVIQPAIPGVGTFSKQPNQGVFADRRISLHNFTIDGMYRTAYQISSDRMVIEADPDLFEYENPKNKYCVDLIVKSEEKEKMHQILKQKLSKSFEVKTKWEKRKQNVAVLFAPDSLQNNLPKASQEVEKGAAGDHFKSNSASFDDFADYLEDYGIVGMAVLNETNDQNLYEIDFKFEPENPKSFFKALEEMGLVIKKREREIDVLVLY